MPDDAELLRRYAATRDEAAFSEIVRRHLGGVYAAALRRLGGDAQFAEDVAQQVFTALARKAATVAGHRFLSAWLYTATRHEAANVVRRERRRKAREQHAHAMNEITHDSAQPPADWNRIAPILDDAIDGLGEADRAAIMLRFVEQRGFAEIGAALEVSTDAARMRVERALEKLRVRLGRRGLTSTLAALGIVLSAHATVPVPVALAASVTGTALAGATVAAGSTVATWITFMSLAKVQMGAAVVAALAIGAAFYESGAARVAREEQLATGQALSVVTARVAALEGGARAAAARTASLKQVLAQAQAGRDPIATPASATALKPDAQLELLRQQIRARQTLERTHPEYQRLTREVGRRDLVRQYGPLYRDLQFTPERIAAFERIMAEYDWMRTDVESAARVEGVTDTDPAIAKLLTGVEQQRDAALRELLGPEQHHQLELFRYAEGVRCEVTNWMAGALYQTAAPLTRAQANALTEITVRHTTASSENHADVQAIQWDAVLAEARSILAPTQMSFLESMRVQMEWRKTFYGAIGTLNEKPATPKPGGG